MRTMSTASGHLAEATRVRVEPLRGGRECAAAPPAASAVEVRDLSSMEVTKATTVSAATARPSDERRERGIERKVKHCVPARLRGS